MALFKRKQQQPVTNMIVPDPVQKFGQYQINVTPTEIITADVKKYKEAIILARGQYTQHRQHIYDIYQNALDFDAQLRGVIEKRLLATAGRKLQYLIGDEPSKQADALIQSPKFEGMVKDLLMSKVFWGMGLIEFGADDWNGQKLLKYSMIPIKHIDPYQGMVRVNQFSVSQGDKSYKNNPLAFFIGEADDFGLLLQASLLAMYKRATMNDWSQYSQLAGTNFRTVQYRGKLDRKRIDTILNTVVSAADGALGYSDEDVNDVKIQNTTSSSQNELFEQLTAYLDDQISKLVLGQTMTTEDGSSRSQAEVHERVQDTIFDSDAKFITDFLNYEFTTIQQKLYGLPSGGRWEFAQSATAKQMEELERDMKIKELGYVFSQEYLKQKYNIND